MRRLRPLVILLALALSPGCVVAGEYQPVGGYGYGYGYGGGYYAPRPYVPAPRYYAPRYYAPAPRPYWRPYGTGWHQPRHHHHAHRWGHRRW